VPLRFYLPLPALIWAALRFGPAGASVALTVVAVPAIWSADRGLGPFLAQSPLDNVLALQVFLLLTTIPVLCLAVVASARQSALELHRALLLSFQDPVAILDARGIVLEVNDSWRRFAEAAGSPSCDRVGRGDDYLGACSAAAAAGDPIAQRALAGAKSVLARDARRFTLEYDRDGDGGREWYTMSVEVLEHSAGGAVITRANITARRRAQLEIEEQREAVRHLSRVTLLGELSGALAHELGQPLASILTNAQAAGHVLRNGTVGPEELAETLRGIVQDIVDEDRRASDVIQRLRALFKRGETRLQPVDPQDLIHEVLELAHAELIVRRVTPLSAVEPGTALVHGDPVQLQQVLLNLILNACDAMSETPVDARLLTLTARAEPDRYIRFSVCDSGSGISAAVVDRLFEPFVTTKPHGLGLGLAISRTIVAAHGGRLWAENNTEAGATVHFSVACVAGGAPEPPPSGARGLAVSAVKVPGEASIVPS
jgi:signal transduction histidine kinase